MKKSYILFRLRFPSGFHFSRGRAEYTSAQETLHSDTLKSAICSAAIKTSGDDFDPAAFLSGFRVSSCFPFMGDELFLPLPLLHAPIRITGITDPGAEAKKLRKLKYVSKPLLERLLQGEGLTIQPSQLVLGGKCLALGTGASHPQPSFEKSILQKVTLRPLPGEPEPASGYTSTPYHLEVQYPGKDAGLFFLLELEGKDASVLPRIRAAMNLLSDEGLGLRKSTGLGVFCVSEERVEMHLPDGAARFFSLSLYCPSQEELAARNPDDCAWMLVKREGWMASADAPEERNKRKRSLYMFSEGSVFEGSKPVGVCHDLKPSGWDHHPVYRDGRALFFPLQIPR